MKLKVFQKGFHYSQDGRGNRLILHLQGCSLHCPWCSNPEGMAPSGALMVEKEWLTKASCPKGAALEGRLHRELCRECEERPCLKIRQKGIRLSFQEYEVEELLAECLRCRPMFFDGGGVTLTGGEVTMQFEEAKELLGRLKEAGIHTAIESNGTHPCMEEYLPLVDEWIMDLKHMDREKHKAWLGTSNETILRNIRLAALRHPDVLIRIPLIPGFNDSPEEGEAFVRFLKECAGGKENVRTELLTYHEFGKGKWGQCGYEYRMPAVRLNPEVVTELSKKLQAAGVTVVRT